MWEPVGNTEDGFSRNKVQNSYVRVINIKNAKNTSRKNRKKQFKTPDVRFLKGDG